MGLRKKVNLNAQRLQPVQAHPFRNVGNIAIGLKILVAAVVLISQQIRFIHKLLDHSQLKGVIVKDKNGLGECPFRSFYVGAAISRPLLEKPELLEQRADNIRPYMASSRIDKMRIRTLPRARQVLYSERNH